MKTKAVEGLRVHVFSANRKQDRGKGTIRNVGPLNIEGWVIPDYPFQIVLDIGEVTEGLDCWWIPLGEVKNIEVNERKGGTITR